MCGCNATAQHGICRGLGYPLVCAARGRNTCRWPRSPRRRRLRRGKVRHRWPRVLCERARDVVVRDVLPGPGRRVRAAGEIGEFAGARGRAPRFGAALAALGAKGERRRPSASRRPRPRSRRSAADTASVIAGLTADRSLAALPLIPHPSLPGLTPQVGFTRLAAIKTAELGQARVLMQSIVFVKLFLRRGWTRGSPARLRASSTRFCPRVTGGHVKPAADTYEYAAVGQLTRHCDHVAAAMTASS